MERLLNELVLEFHRENAAQHEQLSRKLDAIAENVTGLRIKVAVIGATAGFIASLLTIVAKAVAGS